MHRKPLIISLLILFPAALVLVLLLGPWGPGGRDGSRIALKNAEDVNRIILADPYSTAELERRNGTWYLFGSEEVSPVAIENLLFTAGRLEVASITELGAFDEQEDSQEEAREVRLMEGERTLLSFRLRKTGGRYLLNQPGSGKAYYVSIPGYPDLDLESIFSAVPDHYREHLLIALQPSEIRSIEISLASGEAFRFIQDLEGNISFTAANESTTLPDAEPRELAIKLLFSYFTSIRYEQNAGIRADSLTGGGAPVPRMASIKLESFEGERHHLQVFPYHASPGSEAHIFRALVLYNEGQEALFINYIYLDVLMRGLSHYFGEK